MRHQRGRREHTHSVWLSCVFCGEFFLLRVSCLIVLALRLLCWHWCAKNECARQHNLEERAMCARVWTVERGEPQTYPQLGKSAGRSIANWFVASLAAYISLCTHTVVGGVGLKGSLTSALQ